MNGLKWAAAAVALIALGSVAEAEDSETWGSVRGWDIMIDASLGNGCFIYTKYRDGTILRLGFDKSAGNSYILVGHQDWDKIEKDGSYDITLRMDRAAPWHATASGVVLGSLPGLIAHTDDTNFLVDFAKKRNLTVEYRGDTIAKLSLSGTFAALTEMLNCQKAMNGRGGGSVSSDDDGGGGTARKD
jgi:hypothetical protein